MFSFEYLDKSDFDSYASELFEILYGNMSVIVPSGLSCEEDFSSWSSAFGGAFKGREPRKILLVLSQEREVVGFFGYCVSTDTFMMEEIQLLPQYQGKHGIFRNLYEFVIGQLPKNLKYVEAYAHKNNSKSLSVLGKLGLDTVGENSSGSCYLLRGEYSSLLQWLKKCE